MPSERKRIPGDSLNFCPCKPRYLVLPLRSPAVRFLAPPHLALALALVPQASRLRPYARRQNTTGQPNSLAPKPTPTAAPIQATQRQRDRNTKVGRRLAAATLGLVAQRASCSTANRNLSTGQPAAREKEIGSTQAKTYRLQPSLIDALACAVWCLDRDWHERPALACAVWCLDRDWHERPALAGMKEERNGRNEGGEVLEILNRRKTPFDKAGIRVRDLLGFVPSVPSAPGAWWINCWCTCQMLGGSGRLRKGRTTCCGRLGRSGRGWKGDGFITRLACFQGWRARRAGTLRWRGGCGSWTKAELKPVLEFGGRQE